MSSRLECLRNLCMGRNRGGANYPASSAPLTAPHSAFYWTVSSLRRRESAESGVAQLGSITRACISRPRTEWGRSECARVAGLWRGRQGCEATCGGREGILAVQEFAAGRGPRLGESPRPASQPRFRGQLCLLHIQEPTTRRPPQLGALAVVEERQAPGRRALRPPSRRPLSLDAGSCAAETRRRGMAAAPRSTPLL